MYKNKFILLILFGVSVTLLQYLNKCLNITPVKINKVSSWGTEVAILCLGMNW